MCPDMAGGSGEEMGRGSASSMRTHVFGAPDSIVSEVSFYRPGPSPPPICTTTSRAPSAQCSALDQPLFFPVPMFLLSNFKLQG